MTNLIKELKTEKAGLEEKKSDKEKVILAEYEKAVSKYDSELKAYEEYLDKEIQPVDDKLAKAKYVEEMKSHVGDYKRMIEIQEDIENLKEDSAKLTEKIEKARKLPGEIMATATIPIEGLSVVDNTVLINGLPISNLSSGEKLDLCVDVSLQNVAGVKLLLLDGVERTCVQEMRRAWSPGYSNQNYSRRRTDDYRTVKEIENGNRETELFSSNT